MLMNKERCLQFISWNSYEEFTIAICGIRYTYFGVSEALADKIRYKIDSGWNAGRILAFLRKNFEWGKEQEFIPLRQLIADIADIRRKKWNQKAIRRGK